MGGTAVAAPSGGPSAQSDQAHSCAAPAPGEAACGAIQLLDPAHNWRGSHVGSDGHSGTTTATAPTSGYRPADLQSAYNLASISSTGGFVGGVRQTVAIVDAYDDPYAFNDVNIYRGHVGATAIPLLSKWSSTATGPWFRKVNQSGGTSTPRGNSSWAQEISLDLDMVSAICPNCNILLVEASSPSYTNLGTAVNTAVALKANAVSNSYGGPESSSETSYDSYYDHPGVAVTVSSGDNGYGVEYPAASPYVTAVGGTTLRPDSASSRGWSESAWSGAGSGCSAYEPNGLGQTATGCPNRAVADVSAEADPSTGVAVYDTYGASGWLVFGGTSVASPIVASVYALAGNAASITSSYPYSHASSLNDVTSGSNGTCTVSDLCTAGVGYDGPTGLGTPNGTGAF
ncbi:MAG TPA: S53 family peptidase [Acidimicrobiales bacterium]|nr:S53 family peptidase [Acidimicrobiales bacterium]